MSVTSLLNHFYFESFLSHIVGFSLLSSTVNVFSALHVKHFEIWKNILWNWWVDCFIARSIKWCDILGAHSESIFPFMEYYFFFPENYFSFGFIVSCLLLSQSVEILLGNLPWSFSWNLLLPLEWYCQSNLMNLI